MAVIWPKLAFFFGIVSLFHAGYSAAQHRTFMRVTEQEFLFLPTDIGVQGLMSLVLAMYGILHIAGEFKEIRANVQLQNKSKVENPAGKITDTNNQMDPTDEPTYTGKSWETVGNRPMFYTFAHRGRALSPNYVAPKSKNALDGVESISS